MSGAPGALPKFTGSMAMTGRSEGVARWIEASAASMLCPAPSVAADIGVGVCVWFVPAM
jgi:hypothetical protein